MKNVWLLINNCSMNILKNIAIQYRDIFLLISRYRRYRLKTISRQPCTQVTILVVSLDVRWTGECITVCTFKPGRSFVNCLSPHGASVRTEHHAIADHSDVFLIISTALPFGHLFRSVNSANIPLRHSPDLLFHSSVITAITTMD